LKLLITAGPTCEDIDEVRFITNRSSGRMGYAVAIEAVRRGHRAELVSGPVSMETPAGVALTRVRSAEEMLAACRRLFPDCDALVMAAAVADYRPVERVPGKIRKSPGELQLRLERTPDVLAELAGGRRPGQVLVGFALEATDIYESRSSAEGKLADKDMDLVVLNGPGAMGAARADVSFFTPKDGWSGPEQLEKAEVAARIVDYLEGRLRKPK